MMTINCRVADGLIPTEKVVHIEGADGRVEEVALPAQNVTINRFSVIVVGSRQGQVLVELQRESESWRCWRMWINS